MIQSPFNLNQWFVNPQPNSQAEVRLFLFPYAGGAPSVFNKWPAEFPESVETWITHYPGRGSRHNELPIKDLNALVENIFLSIQPLLGKPFIFFGHSLGGMVAHELARRLQQNKLSQPQILFVSACGAPYIPDPHVPIHALPDHEFIKSLRQLNGIPADVMNHFELMELLLPILRADFEAVENYQYTPDGHLLTCPIVAFGGSEDPRVNRERLEGWRSQTNASFKLRYFSGGHFFIHTAREAVLTSMVTEMASLYANG